MSVVAKMNVQSMREFGRASLIKLSCVYENDGLNGAGYEDRRFTTATPWGEGDLTTPRDSLFHGPDGENNWGSMQALYLVFRPVSNAAEEALASPLLSLPVKVKSLDLSSYKRVELVLDRDRAGPEKDTALNIRLSIDNPAALEQFPEGAQFNLAIYDAGEVTLAEATA